MGGVHRLQVGVGLVEPVLLPVLGQGLDVAVVIDAGGVLPRPIGVVGLVDVVAEADDEVDVLLRHRTLGVEEAGLVLLAGIEGDPQRLLRVGRRPGAETAHGRMGVLGEEAVEVLASGLQPADAGPGGEIAVGAGRHRLLEDGVLEVAVLGDLQLQAGGLLQALRTRPEDRALGVGEAGGHALRELDLLGERDALAARHRGVVDRRGQRGAGREPADQEGAPAQSRRALELVKVESHLFDRVSVHRCLLLVPGVLAVLNHGRGAAVYQLHCCLGVAVGTRRVSTVGPAAPRGIRCGWRRGGSSKRQMPQRATTYMIAPPAGDVSCRRAGGTRRPGKGVDMESRLH